MPKIEPLFARERVPELELPRPGPQSFGLGIGKGLEEIGQTVKQIDDEIRAVGEAGTAERILRGTTTSLDEEFERLSAEADHTTFRSSFTQARDRLRQEALEQVKGLSPRAQRAVIPDIERMVGVWDIKANHKARELTANFEIADAHKALPLLARLSAKAEFPEQKEYFVGLGRGRIQSLRSFLPAPRIVEIEQRFEKEIEKERQSFFTVDLSEKLDDLLNQALRQPDLAVELHSQGSRLIDQAGGDWLPADDREKAKSKFKGALWAGAVRGRLESDPAGVQADLRAGRYDPLLDQETILQLRKEARVNLDKTLSKLVADYKDARLSGFDWRGPVSEKQLGALVKGTELEAEFLNIVQAGDILEKFNRLPPVAQENYLRQKAAGPKTGEEAQFFKTLESAHQRTRELLEKDPLTFAVRQRVIPAPPPLNPNDPQSLQARSRLAEMAENRYGRPVSPLSDDEVDQLRIMLDQAPAAGKVAILRTLAANLADRQVKMVAAQIARKKEDNILALAMGMSVDAPRTAERILGGREILRDNPKVNPSGVDLTTAHDRINQLFGAAYMHNPEHHATVAEAAFHLYALRSWQERDLSGIYNKSRLDEAANEATGGLLTISRGFLRGSYKIQPPRPGVTEDQFLDMVGRADLSKARGLKPEEVRRHGIFESVGDGRYLVRIGPGYVQGEKGPFILDLSGIGSRAAHPVEIAP